MNEANSPFAQMARMGRSRNRCVGEKAFLNHTKSRQLLSTHPISRYYITICCPLCEKTKK